MLESTPIHSEVYRKLVERLKAPPQLRLRWVFFLPRLDDRNHAADLTLSVSAEAGFTPKSGLMTGAVAFKSACRFLVSTSRESIVVTRFLE